MNHHPVRHYACAVLVLIEYILKQAKGLPFVQIRLAVAALFMIDVRSLERERLYISRVRLGHACIDKMAAPLLHVVERNPNKAHVLGQVRWAPRNATSLVVKRSGEIP